MGYFNEIQKGIPDLGKTYWQDLKGKETDDGTVPEIVEMNCQSAIFNPNISLKNFKGKPDIFHS